MKPFLLEGDFQMGRRYQHYRIELAAKDEAAACERLLATLGSRHGVNRRQIRIAAVKSLKPAEVHDPMAAAGAKA